MRRAALVLFVVGIVACLVCLGRTARAETLQAPIGGRPILLGEGRVACAPAAGGWVAEDAGRVLRPPTADSAVGTVVEVRVAPSGACVQKSAVVRLVATGPWPRIDVASFVLAVDEGRLEGRGHGLRGVTVTWPIEGGGRAGDTCGDPKFNPTETCTWGVPKTLPADPSASPLQLLPRGAQAVPDSVIFDSEGRKAPPQAFALVPGRVEILSILPPDASVDVSSGVGRAPLSHAEAVAGVDCGGVVRCTLEGGALLVPAPPPGVASLDVKFRLVPHAFYARRNPPDTQPVLRVSILRCTTDVVSGPALRATDSARVVVRVEGACMRDIGLLRFLIGTRHADVVQIERANDATYVVLNVGNVDAPTLAITAVRGEGEAAVVAVARTETRSAPVVRTVIEIPGFPPMDFIPNNRRAIVHHPHVDGAELVLLPVADVYDTKTEGEVSTVQGDVNAAGAVTLQFGYRVPTLPPPLDKLDLAVLSDPLRRNVKEANLPAPIGLSALSAEPLVEVVCADGDGKVRRVEPGVVPHLSFSLRDGCRVIFHRQRLSPEYGTQKLSLEMEVDKLDGTPRADAHVSQTIVLRAGTEPFIAWIKGVHAPYDRVVVRLSHVADEAHYLGALEIATGAPTVQWAVVFGTGRVRLYATSAIPTGLYRFGSGGTSGVLSLSIAIISRLTWLDSEGHEGLLGLEAGLMAFGLTVDTSPNPVTQVGAVLGIGLSIPIAGAGSPTQASINLHGWVEERITGSGAEASSQRAIIFGPSISVGNVGTTF